jgi:methyl-accepting chemotaxis protein
MTANAQTVPQPAGGPPKRRLRNYLLDTRFQLKYTGMVVVVTFLVATVLGWLAYEQSRGQTDMMRLDAMDPANDAATTAFIMESAEEYDRNMLLAICGGVIALVVSLGVTGIIVTHRVVGPAYKLKRLFQDVSEGHLRVYGKLRQGDELWDVFVEFEKMINKLRQGQRDEIAQLQGIIDRAKAASATEDVVKELEGLRDRMEAELE